MKQDIYVMQIDISLKYELDVNLLSNEGYKGLNENLTGKLINE